MFVVVFFSHKLVDTPQDNLHFTVRTNTMAATTMDEEKRATLEELDVEESKVEPLMEKLAALVADEELDESECGCAKDPYFARRCLIACYNDEKKAFKMATSALRWRSTVKPSKITPDDFATAHSQNMWSLACHGKNGWPVCFGFAVRWNPWRYGTAEYSRMIAFNMEACEKGFNPEDPMSRIYFVLDMKNMSKLMSDLRKIAELTKFASTYYPERVVVLVLNSDFVTFALWKFVSPLLDKRTRERVTILRSNGLDLLDELIGLENVGPILGGTRAEEWPTISMETRENFQWGVDATGRSYDTPVKSEEPDEREVPEAMEEPVEA